jgi:hypothetical protein
LDCRRAAAERSRERALFVRGLEAGFRVVLNSNYQKLGPRCPPLDIENPVFGGIDGGTVSDYYRKFATAPAALVRL